MNKISLHVVFAGGGTGGHLFPGLAVAERLAAMIPGVRISFCGSGKAFEREHVSRAGFDYFAMPSRPLPHGLRQAVAFLIANSAGYLAAARFLRERDVAAVVGLGGYASVPMGQAAAHQEVPLVLLEQNVVPGRATRWLARRAALICTAFEETSLWLRRPGPVRVTGNPIRSGFQVPSGQSALVLSAHRPKAGREMGPVRQLLVLGGSGGAQALNEDVPRALDRVRSRLTGWRVVHQSGETGFAAARAQYVMLALEAAVVPFVSDMSQTLAATDLAICRAGGTTLAELAACGVPALLLPYPHATDHHQAANARHFAAGGGCITIDPRPASGRPDTRLVDSLSSLLASEERRRRMSAAMFGLARPRAAGDVAELIEATLRSRSRQGRQAAA